ncbi:MFS transporter [Microlunatus soli]|uniref:MFS transporter, putative metabolite:H+ symporter n=1 Tax=Microlunatus soli TaxID=630515 RepID=A0A1H2AIA9_9ACTN|nr:MFS transporter [Microlunatus soli]SDT45708.1 MFS transporter, putative metabolite:H+ symporter [Microlunatus soli]
MADLLDRLERIPYGRPHRKLQLQGGLGYVFDTMDAGVVSFILPVVAGIWALSTQQVGLLGSSTYFGYFFGALVAGQIGDRYGRKVVMLGALGFYAVFTLIAATSVHWLELFFLRALAGFGTGAESAIIAPFLAEFVPSKYRGRYVGVISGFFSFGFVVAALLGKFVVPLPDGWRWVQVITALPIVMILIWRRSIPESPRYLIRMGRMDEARAVIERLEGQSGRGPVPASQAAPTPDDSVIVERRLSPLASIAELFRAGRARRTAVAWIVWLVQTFAYYGFITWIPSLLVARGLDISKSFTFSLLIYVMMVPGYFTAAYLNDLLDRKIVIAGYSIGAGIAALGMALAQSNTQVLIAGMALSLFLNGVYSGLYSYTPEIFPTRVRATGMATTSAIARLGAIAAPIIIGAAYSSLGFGGVFTMMVIVLAIGIAAILIFGVSTAGRSLEELNEGTGQSSTVRTDRATPAPKEE